MSFSILLAEAVFWSILWNITISVSIRVFPFTMEHDYPDDVRKTARIAEPSKEQKRNGTVFTAVCLSILFGLLIAFAVLQYRGQEPSFFKIFFHLWLICMTWNAVDLIIIDWLLIGVFSTKYFVLPGTEDYEGNKNYRFHFMGFLKGLAAMTIVAMVFTTLSYLILLWFR